MVGLGPEARGWPGLTKVYLQPFGGRSVTVNLPKITLNYMLRITLYIWETVFPKNGIEAIGILKILLRIPNRQQKNALKTPPTLIYSPLERQNTPGLQSPKE